MTKRYVAWLAWGLCTVVVACAIGALILGAASGQSLRAMLNRYDIPGAAAGIAFSAVGALIATRRSGNPIGWIFLIVGTSQATESFVSAYTIYGVLKHPGSLPGTSFAAWLGTWAWAPGFGLWATLSLLLFPTGRPPSPRWRWVVWVVGAAVAVIAVPLMFAAVGPSTVDLLRDEAPPDYVQITSVIGLLLLAVAMLTSAASVIVRFRRSRGDEREQLKWLVFAGAFTAGVLVALSFGSGDWVRVTGLVPGLLLGILAPIAIPVAAAIAILKYRLYDIDVVINRTVVFGLLAAFITAIYIAIVVGVGAAFGSSDKPNLLLSIAATAIVALAFQPVRRRVQRFANRIVYGKRATPYEVMADFCHRMADALSVEEVLPRMAEVAARGVGAKSSRVSVFLPDGGRRAVSWPAGDGAASFDRSVAVTYRDEPVGEIAVAKSAGDVMTPADDDLLRDLASQAGLALHNSRLAVELQARLEEISAQATELRESRERIVASANLGRRRLEREIHDGPELRLLAMSEQLKLVNPAIDERPEAAAALLESLGRQANDTLERLRDLARGIFPPLLADKGLVSALDAHIRKVGMPVSLDVDDSFADIRFDEAVETAAYFCAVQALQNVHDHARDAPSVVSLGAVDGDIEVVVTDQGRGFDPEAIPYGLTLRVTADRLEALGGTLEVESKPGQGTTVRGRIPTRALASVA